MSRHVMSLPSRLVVGLLLAAAAAIWFATAAAMAGPPPSAVVLSDWTMLPEAHRDDTSIGSREALALHLATHSPYLGAASMNRSPFSRLPDRARQRFVQSLRFHPEHGLVGGSFGLLTRDLTREQAHELLTLIGSYVAADAIQGWHSSSSTESVDALAESPVPSRHERVHDDLIAIQEVDGWWDRPAAERLAAMAREVDEVLFDPGSARVLAGLDNTELDWLWEIVNHVGFYANEAVYTDRVVVAFEELASRRLAQPRHVLGTFERLIAGRRFVAAGVLAARFNEIGLPKVPTLIDDGNAGQGVVVYRPRSLGELVVEPVDISRGWQVVGMVSRHCGVSRQLLDHLADHPMLLDGVSTVWIETVNGHLGLQELLDWNRAQPALAIMIPHAAADWPFVEAMATPQLWLLHEGVVMQMLDGWQSDTSTQLADLLARARRGGVPDSAD